MPLFELSVIKIVSVLKKIKVFFMFHEKSKFTPPPKKKNSVSFSVTKCTPESWMRLGVLLGHQK